ncbi:hypothetical protein SDJN03_04079, partial [Cucurbita argyrosperma subsp. sororia]
MPPSAIKADTKPLRESRHKDAPYKYEQSRSSSMEYGGPSTSSTAHGVIAVNKWMLPPDVGYKTEVLQGEDRISFQLSLPLCKNNPSSLQAQRFHKKLENAHFHKVW